MIRTSNDISKKESREKLKELAEIFGIPYRRVLELYHAYRKDGLSRDESVDNVYDWLYSLTESIRKSAEVLEDKVKWAAKTIGEKAALEQYRFHTRNIPNRVRKYTKTNRESGRDKWDYDEDWLNDE